MPIDPTLARMFGLSLQSSQRANLGASDPFQSAIEACDAILDRINQATAALANLRQLTLEGVSVDDANTTLAMAEADIAAADELMARLREGEGS